MISTLPTGATTWRGTLALDGTRTYEWDAENRLVAVVQGTRRSEFTYNGLGQRVHILEKDGAVVLSDRQYIWCGLSICEERDGSGSSVLRRFFHQGVQEGTDTYFYTRDHLGSIREMTDSSGAVRARYGYDPYGRQTKLSGDKDASFGFTGHFKHASSGLELAPYRAYDSSLGRWISPDPIGFGGGSVNLYTYVANSPGDWVDPTGKFPVILVLTPPGLAALTAAAKATIFVATAVAAGVGLAEMTKVNDPPQPTPPIPPPPVPIPPAVPPAAPPAAPPVTVPTPVPVPVPPVTIPTTEVPKGDPCPRKRDPIKSSCVQFWLCMTSPAPPQVKAWKCASLALACLFELLDQTLP